MIMRMLRVGHRATQASERTGYACWAHRAGAGGRCHENWPTARSRGWLLLHLMDALLQLGRSGWRHRLSCQPLLCLLQLRWPRLLLSLPVLHGHRSLSLLRLLALPLMQKCLQLLRGRLLPLPRGHAGRWVSLPGLHWRRLDHEPLLLLLLSRPRLLRMLLHGHQLLSSPRRRLHVTGWLLCCLLLLLLLIPLRWLHCHCQFLSAVTFAFFVFFLACLGRGSGDGYDGDGGHGGGGGHDSGCGHDIHDGHLTHARRAHSKLSGPAAVGVQT